MVLKKSMKKTGSLRERYQKKDESTLSKSYEERDKRTKTVSRGKSIYVTERLEEFGISEWKPTKAGEYFFIILPQSIEATIPYFKAIAKHSNVGIENDNFICMQQYTDGDQKCFRCLKQAEGWRMFDGKDKIVKSQLVSMYPNDRIIYLIYDVTSQFLEDEEPEETIQVWDAPKLGAHAGIQDTVRDKKTGKILDISDISDGSDSQGRVVYMKVTVREDKETGNRFPQYGSFDLIERDTPIPDSVLEKLEELMSTAESEGMTAIEYLLHFPESEEIEESMSTELIEFDKSPIKKAKKKKEEIPKINIEEISEEITNLKGLKLKKWIKSNIDSEDERNEILEMDDEDEMKDAIISYFENENE